MYHTYIVKRTQIYIDESQDERLSKRARAAGTTKSDLIREALDAFLGKDDDDTRLLAFRAAVRAAAGAARRLPRGREYVEEVRTTDLERAREIEARFRA